MQQKAWDEVNTDIKWWAPGGLYWICGITTYTVLPQNWSGFWVLGLIYPSFFLLPFARGESLGVQVYEYWENQTKWHALQIGNWKDDKAPLSIYPLLWCSHLGRGQILWIPYSHLYVKLHLSGYRQLLNNLIGGWFSTLGGFKTLIGVVFLFWGLGLSYHV